MSNNKKLVKKLFEKEEKTDLNSDKHMKNFIEWLKKNNVQSDDLYFKLYNNEERGVYTRNDIPKNKTIMFIPLDALITDILGKQVEWSKKLDQSGAFSHKGELLKKITYVMLYILSTIDNPDEKFKPYYDILPTVMDNFPLFWEEEELNLLQGSPFLDMIENRKRSISEDYNIICKVLPELEERFSEDDFMWCRTIVGSRNFGLNIHGHEATAMVPLADMLNHFRPAETKWFFDNTRNGYIMNSLENLSAETQVMDSYGAKSNYKFLLHYGFCMENCDETDNQMKLSFKFNGREYFLDNTGNSYDFDRLCKELRITVSNDEELQQNPNSKINDRNEMAMLAVLSLECRKKLAKYKYSYKKSEKMFKSYDRFTPERNIFNIILSEQKILKYYIDYANKTILDLSKQ